MVRVPPTTSQSVAPDDRSPCCDADLIYVSPPRGYECRECGERYTSTETDADEMSESDGGTCTETLTSGTRAGEPCGRDLPCPYHD